MRALNVVFDLTEQMRGASWNFKRAVRGTSTSAGAGLLLLVLVIGVGTDLSTSLGFGNT